MSTTTNTYAVKRGGNLLAGGEGAARLERYFVHFAAGDDYCELPTTSYLIESASHLMLTAPDASQLIYLNETNSSDGVPVASKGTVQLKRTVTTSALDVGVDLLGR